MIEFLIYLIPYLGAKADLEIMQPFNERNWLTNDELETLNAIWIILWIIW